MEQVYFGHYNDYKKIMKENNIFMNANQLDELQKYFFNNNYVEEKDIVDDCDDAAFRKVAAGKYFISL